MRVKRVITSSIGIIGLVLLWGCGGIGGPIEGGGGGSTGGGGGGSTGGGGGGSTGGGGGGTTGGGGGSNLSFATDIAPILNAKCTGCHSGNSPSGGLKLTTYADTMTVVTAGNAAASVLIQEINPGGSMASYISSANRTTVTNWVTQGALP